MLLRLNHLKVTLLTAMFVVAYPALAFPLDPPPEQDDTFRVKQQKSGSCNVQIRHSYNSQGISIRSINFETLDRQQDSPRCSELEEIRIIRRGDGDLEIRDRQQDSIKQDYTNPNRHLYQLEQQADIYYREGQFEQALEILQQLISFFQENNDSSSQAIILEKIGELEVNLGKYYKALDSYQQALEIYRETGDRLGEATILSSIAELSSNPHFLTIPEFGNLTPIIIGTITLNSESGGGLSLSSEGISLSSQSEERGQHIIINDKKIIHFSGSINVDNEERSGEAEVRDVLSRSEEEGKNIMINIEDYGRIDTYGKGILSSSALNLYQQALDIYQQINEPVKAADTLNSMGVVYMEQGDYSNALESYQKGLVIFIEHQDRTREGRILNNIGEVYRKLSQYSKALDYYEQALKTLEVTNEMVGTAATFNNIGLVHQELGSISSALNYYQNALTIHREVNNRPDEATTLNNLGLAYEELDKNEQALDYYEKSLTVRREISDRSGEATTLNNLGLLHNKLNNHAQALKLLEQALSTFQELGKRADEGNTLDSIGTVYKSMGNYSQALKHYLQALEIVQEFGNRTLEGIVLTNIGEVYELQGKNSQAITFYQQAIDQVIETILVDLKGETLKSSFADKHVDTYTRLINLLWDEGRFTEAFNYVERTKARLFLNQIANGTVNLRDGADDDLLQKEQELRNEINRLNNQLLTISNFLLNQNNTSAIAALQSELTAREQDYIKLLDRLKRQNPEVADLVSVNPAQLAEIQSLLDTDTTLVEYFVTDNRTLAFVITRDTLTPVTLDVSKQSLQEAIQRFYEYDFATLSSQHPQSLTQLHQWLIAPLQPHISTPKVSLVPHNVLHYLPFAALSDGKDYLVDNYTLFNLPSASMLRFLQGKRKPDSGELMALGNPTLDLPFAKQEVEKISNLYATQPLLGRQATERTVWSQANQAGILHLATHGEYNPHSPLFSTLRLAPDNNYDGRLEVHEIYQLDLRQATNLVVLSACQTQVGQLSKGDELIGLNRAFLYAGTPSVIATLWNVDDPATGFLMERFYTYLRQGKSKAEALQQAQKDTRIEYPNPYYWAAFVLTGDGGTMP
jgi:CHAT domain-containing protein/Tfp pilus assembly protein PilF